jgi:collagenase-like PrtC family protease
LTLEEIRKIADTCPVEIEAFVHGAMCMSYSGRCLMSAFLSNRDSNRGGRPEAEWTPVESRAAPTPCTVYVPGRRWTSVEPR